MEQEINIKGISHLTFICKDLAKTTKMLRELFLAKEVYSSGDKYFSLSKEKFFRLVNLWIVIMEGEPVEQSYNHLAFQVNEEQLPWLEQKIKALGLTLLPGRKREPAEGKSIYFYDYDNHLFEFHTGDLDKRLAYYNK